MSKKSIPSPLIFRVQNNTDSIDINQKCLGLDSWVVGDEVSLLNSNRGLHIQIRHNRNKATFETANQLSRLISAAPELLEIAKAYRNLLKTMAHTEGEVATYQHIQNVLVKAEGSHE